MNVNVIACYQCLKDTKGCARSRGMQIFVLTDGELFVLTLGNKGRRLSTRVASSRRRRRRRRVATPLFLLPPTPRRFAPALLHFVTIRSVIMNSAPRRTNFNFFLPAFHPLNFLRVKMLVYTRVWWGAVRNRINVGCMNDKCTGRAREI